MKKIYTIVIVFLLSSYAIATIPDSIKIYNLQLKFEQLENQTKEVRRDELNYQIEKNLLKETYSNNYSHISLIITLGLALIALIGYLGIKDITGLKKEYVTELSRLKTLQSEFEAKVKDFGETKIKYEKEISDINKQSDEQNLKIKILEIKDKINNLFKDDNCTSALEYCIVGLELAPNDINLLHWKARLYTRIRNYDESIKAYKRILEIDPSHQNAISDLAEVYLFNNQIENSDEIVVKHSSIFKDKDSGKVLELFNLIKLYHKAQVKEMLEAVKAKIDQSDIEINENRINGWDVQDALIFVFFNVDSNQKFILVNYLFYLKGQINGKDLNERLNQIVI